MVMCAQHAHREHMALIHNDFHARHAQQVTCVLAPLLPLHQRIFHRMDILALKAIIALKAARMNYRVHKVLITHRNLALCSIHHVSTVQPISTTMKWDKRIADLAVAVAIRMQVMLCVLAMV